MNKVLNGYNIYDPSITWWRAFLVNVMIQYKYNWVERICCESHDTI